ncbi:hypothetical protein ACRAVF_24055 [Bradyrhizobium oligotrophicum S58]
MPELKHAAVLEDEADAAVCVGLNDVALSQHVSVIERDRDAVTNDDHVAFGVDHASNDLHDLLLRSRCVLINRVLASSKRNEPIFAALRFCRRPPRRLVLRQMPAGDAGCSERLDLTLVCALMRSVERRVSIHRRACSDGS